MKICAAGETGAEFRSKGAGVNINLDNIEASLIQPKWNL